MPPTAGMKCTGMYAIYDEVNQGVKLIDDNEYAEVKDKVTSGKPNIDSIDYEKCRDRMRFQPLVIRRFPLRPVSPNDLLAVYDAANQAVIAVTRAEYEKNKLKYEPEVQIPAHAVAAPPPAMTAAFEEPAPAAPAPAAPAPAAPAPAAPAPAAPVAAVPTPPPVEVASCESLKIIKKYLERTHAPPSKTLQFDDEKIKLKERCQELNRQNVPIFLKEYSTNDNIITGTSPVEGINKKEEYSKDASLPYHKMHDPHPECVQVFEHKVPEEFGHQVLQEFEYQVIEEYEIPEAFQHEVAQSVKGFGESHLSVPDAIVNQSRKILDDADDVYISEILAEADRLLADDEGCKSPKPEEKDEGADENTFENIQGANSHSENLDSKIFPENKTMETCLKEEITIQGEDMSNWSTQDLDSFAQTLDGAMESLCELMIPPDSQQIESLNQDEKSSPQSFAELLFVPPKAGPVTLNPDDLVAVYDKTNQAVIAIPRHVHEKGGDFSAAAVPAEPPAKTTAPVPTTATSAPQKTADLIFQPPKAGKVELSPDDLLAVYDEATQSVILVTRKQYNQGGDFSAAASPKPPAKIAAPSAPQNTADLIFQPPKAGPVELNPDDLLAVYDEATQSVIVVTRKQYNQGGDFSVSAAAAPAQPPAKTTASSAPQKTADLIYQPPKAGPVELNPDDLLAVYDEATQSVILVTRKQYNQESSIQS